MRGPLLGPVRVVDGAWAGAPACCVLRAKGAAARCARVKDDAAAAATTAAAAPADAFSRHAVGHAGRPAIDRVGSLHRAISKARSNTMLPITQTADSRQQTASATTHQYNSLISFRRHRSTFAYSIGRSAPTSCPAALVFSFLVSDSLEDQPRHHAVLSSAPFRRASSTHQPHSLSPLIVIPYRAVLPCASLPLWRSSSGSSCRTLGHSPYTPSTCCADQAPRNANLTIFLVRHLSSDVSSGRAHSCCCLSSP